MSPFTTQFTLSRDYLGECFDQSAALQKKNSLKLWLPLFLLAVGLVLLYFTEQPKMAGSLFIGLAILELIHSRFKRAWWLTRQMWGRSGNSEVTLSIDNDGIETQNPYTKTRLLWSEVDQLIETEQGLMLLSKTGGRQYLSKSLFPDNVVVELRARFE